MREHSVNSHRFERKFIIPGNLVYSIEQIIKASSAMFSEVFYPRFVNNIYFDSVSFQFFHDNINGVSERTKARIRWYGDLERDIKKPVLEFKQKFGLTGIKTAFPLEPFSLRDIGVPNFRSSLFQKSALDFHRKELMISLKPTLINRYRRKYFLSADRKFRITLDHCLEYFPANLFENISIRRFNDSISMIMELKYDKEHQPESSELTQEFLFRLVKNSKYVRGIQILHDIGHDA